MHERNRLSNAEKLVYLQHAIKNGSAKAAFKGLSRSGDYYLEANCLKSCDDRPRLIHRSHVQKNMEASSLMDGNSMKL